MQSLQSSFPVLKKVNSQMTNGEKLLLFVRDSLFRHRLCEKLLEQVKFCFICSLEAKNCQPSKCSFIQHDIALSFRKNLTKMIWSRSFKDSAKFQSFSLTKPLPTLGFNPYCHLTCRFKYWMSLKLSLIYWGFLFVGVKLRNSLSRNNYFLLNLTQLQRPSVINRLRKSSTQNIRFILHVLHNLSYPRR
jgi:hypothetical protein